VVRAVSPAVAAGAHRAAEVVSVTGEAVAAAVVGPAVSLAAVVDAVARAGSQGAVAAVASVEDADGEAVVSAEVDGDSEQRLCVGHFLCVMVFLGLVWFSGGVKGVIVHLGVQIPITVSKLLWICYVCTDFVRAVPCSKVQI